MQVGDIGVLQKLEYLTWLNGTTAEVVEVASVGHRHRVLTASGEELIYRFDNDGYFVKVFIGKYLAIEKHQIRPLSDPDKEQDAELYKEVVS